MEGLLSTGPTPSSLLYKQFNFAYVQDMIYMFLPEDFGCVGFKII